MRATNAKYSETYTVKLNTGRHQVKLVGIEAPDGVGTYRISFSNNVQVLPGSHPRTGTDLTPRVEKFFNILVLKPANQSMPMKIQSKPYEVFSTQDVEKVR
jgi:hypothetical protein